MVEDLVSGLRWGVRKRLEFIEFQLFWEGRMRRADLAAAFGMSAQQASADIAQYQQIAPENLVYETASRTYVRTDAFSPRLVAEQTDRYLLQLVALSSGWMQEDETWFPWLSQRPPVEVVALKRSPTHPGHLLAVLDAIRGRQEISIFYHSMTAAVPSWRSIAPHALANCAGRWHVRAWSREHNEFRDYNINRIVDVKDARPCSVDRDLDYQWLHVMDHILIPNPELDDESRKAVASDYGMEDGQRAFPLRLALTFYLMTEHNMDVDRLRPQKQQVMLQNRQAVEQAREQVGQLSREALRRAGAS